MIDDVVTERGRCDAELEAWTEAQAAIADAVETLTPTRAEELATQILIETSMGDNSLSPAAIRRLKLIVDTTG